MKSGQDQRHVGRSQWAEQKVEVKGSLDHWQLKGRRTGPTLEVVLALTTVKGN